MTRREVEQKLRRNPPLVRADARYLASVAGDRVVYAPTAQRDADLVAGSRRYERAGVGGTGAALPEIRALDVSEGRFFSVDEERRGAAVVVLGRDVAEALFAAADPLGQTVRIGGRGFVVVGVQARLGTAGGISLDRYAWLPLQAWERVFGPAATLQVSARPPAGGAFDLAEDRARASLRARRHLAPGDADNFDVISPEASQGFVLALAGRVAGAGPLLGGMALLAALVVVANTTLVAVSQRTFEIGVRRAVGATRQTILAEVLAEAAIVALAGGVLGVTLVAAGVVGLAAALDLPVSVTASTVVIALAGSLATGLVAGWLPARRASRLDVINALRAD